LTYTANLSFSVYVATLCAHSGQPEPFLSRTWTALDSHVRQQTFSFRRLASSGWDFRPSRLFAIMAQCNRKSFCQDVIAPSGSYKTQQLAGGQILEAQTESAVQSRQPGVRPGAMPIRPDSPRRPPESALMAIRPARPVPALSGRAAPEHKAQQAVRRRWPASRHVFSGGLLKQSGLTDRFPPDKVPQPQSDPRSRPAAA
jgi:hypothetical protein